MIIDYNKITKNLLDMLPSPEEIFIRTMIKAKEKGMTFEEYVEWEMQEYKKNKTQPENTTNVKK